MNKVDKDAINSLVNLYFKYNPQNNRGMAFKIKAWDIISAYYLTHKKTYEDIIKCIESQPVCQVPIWEQFNNYFNKTKKESNYKKSISDSTNAEDWL